MALNSKTLFHRLCGRLDRFRQFDAIWALSDPELDARGLKRESLAKLLLADSGLS